MTGINGNGGTTPTRLYAGFAQYSSGQVTVSTGLSTLASCTATALYAGIGATEFVTVGTSSGGSCTFYSSTSALSTSYIYYIIAGTP
jgi:hypothetical protein